MTTLFNSSQWQQLIVDVYGYEPYRLPATMFGITPAFKVKSWVFGQKITNMPFNFYPALLTTETQEQNNLLEFFIDQCNAHKKIGVELKFSSPLSKDLLMLKSWSVHQPFIRSTLSLKQDSETTYRQASPNLRKNLNRIRNKVKRNQIELTLAQSPQEIQAFYDLLVQVYRDRHQMVCHPKKLYDQLFQRNLANFYLAKDQQTVIAGVVILLDQEKHYYAWGATHPHYLNIGVAMGLLDKAIQSAIDQGVTEFDFGTSPPSDHNLLEFKRRWGCDSIPTYYYKYPPKVQDDTPDLHTSYKTVRQLYKFVPTPVIKALLPIIIPHFG